jgi:hypothetical protein
VSLVPGNHDVNIIDRTNPGRLDLPWSAGQSLRKLRVVLVLDALAGNRTHVVHRASGGVGPLLKDYLRQGQRPELLRELANRGTIRGRREMTKVWEAIFPLVSISLRERIGLALINAPDLVAVLAPHSRRVIVLPGHRHRDWIGVCGNIVLCSAPSLGTDSVDKYRGSFRIHQLLAKAGGLQLIATERVRVS